MECCEWSVSNLIPVGHFGGEVVRPPRVQSRAWNQSLDKQQPALFLLGLGPGELCTGDTKLRVTSVRPAKHCPMCTVVKASARLVCPALPRAAAVPPHSHCAGKPFSSHLQPTAAPAVLCPVMGTWPTNERSQEAKASCQQLSCQYGQGTFPGSAL